MEEHCNFRVSTRNFYKDYLGPISTVYFMSCRRSKIKVYLFLIEKYHHIYIGPLGLGLRKPYNRDLRTEVT